MNFCSRCVLPDTFPGIQFNDKQVCNYCTGAHVPDNEKKKEYTEKFENLLESVRGKYDYDVIMAYSGGKDSTYTLYILAKKYNMRILALTFDNGFISPRAAQNIVHMTDLCGATSMFVRPSFELMKKVFAVAAREDFYSPKTLDRASSICTTCIGHVKSLVLKTALQMRIPLAAYGWSPGQAPITSAIMQTSPRMQSITNKTVRDPLFKRFPKELRPFFISDDDLKYDPDRWPINIHPLAFLNYNENDIVKLIQSLGWVMPQDTDPNSSNCTLNALANYLHRKKFGFHPYAWEIAGIVRSGSMERSEGIEKTNQPEDINMVRYGAERIGVELK
jgi:tRNA(Ile)-lysidine synthase TilS/MesJ